MGVSTSSKLTLLPGIDGTITNAADSALDSNDKVLDILQNSASATGTQEAIDLANEVAGSLTQGKLTNNPLPTPVYFAHYSSNQGSMTVLDEVGQTKFSSTLDNSNNFYQNYQSVFYTESNISSNQYTSNYGVQGTSMGGADGHWWLNAPSEPGNWASYSDWAKHANNGNRFPRYGTIIGEEGIRQPYSPYLSGSTLQWSHRGSYTYIETLNVASSTYSTWNGGQQSATGLVSYNDRTKTLLVVETTNSSNSYRLHIWRNANRSLNTDFVTGDLHTFLSEAKAAGTPSSVDDNLYYFYNDFTWSTSNSSSYSESQYRGKLFMGDNGKIGFSRMTPSTDLRYAVISPDIIQTAAGVAEKGLVGTTTTYGYEQGDPYGIRHEIAWDNKWAVAWSPYYYYGSGMVAFFIDTENPDNYYYAQNGDTSWGNQIVPFQESKFLWNNTANNSNSAGPYAYIIDPAGIAETGYRSSSIVSNGANIGFSSQGAIYYNIDTEYTSTNYPVLFSPSRWGSY
jgi:hypothetical protein